MNKEQMLLDALNRFGNFTSVTQEFSEEQLGVIYELMDMVEQRNKVSGDDTRTEPALPIQNVSVSFLSEGMANKIYKQIGLLAEKQGGITGITTLNQLPSGLQNFMKKLAADYGRQIDFLKSVLANER